MAHPLVTQLRFTRSEFVRCLAGVTPDEALRRIGPMNCLSWMVGHLAAQEHFMWVVVGQGRTVAPDLREQVGYGRPASTPDWDEMWHAWHTVTDAADLFLDTLTADRLDEHLILAGEPRPESVGTSLLRNICHYWFHLGEAHAVRQQLGHVDLPEFVGNMASVRF